MQVTREQLIQFVQNNFYVLSHLSKLYAPLEGRNWTKWRIERYNKFTVEMIFGQERHFRLTYSRYLLMYAMAKNGYTHRYIGSLFNYSNSAANVGKHLIIRYLNRYASADEIQLINELVADFKKEFNIVKKYSKSEQ